jgi:hypothetical protein
VCIRCTQYTQVTLPYHFYKLKKDTQLLGDEDCWKYNGMEAGKQEDVYLAPQLQLRWGSALERIFMTLDLQTVIKAVHALPLSENWRYCKRYPMS